MVQHSRAQLGALGLELKQLGRQARQQQAGQYEGLTTKLAARE